MSHRELDGSIKSHLLPLLSSFCTFSSAHLLLKGSLWCLPNFCLSFFFFFKNHSGSVWLLLTNSGYNVYKHILKLNHHGLFFENQNFAKDSTYIFKRDGYFSSFVLPPLSVVISSPTSHAGVMVCSLSVQPVEKPNWQILIESVYWAPLLSSPLLSSPLLSSPLLDYSLCMCYLEVKVMNLNTHLWNIPLQGFEPVLQRGKKKIDADVDHSTLKVIPRSRSTHGISTLPRLLSCFSAK